ncbi:hypothetical protein OOK44_36525 [Streptomyces cellulosae]|uniref:hypothetical protein n=1 Tax=Streptomyces cellulosae TaxID=1968 RepID=UPI002251A109|nr:hypothetical protein [Streptomyces cellulosae]WTC60965.1 hypothetical protein OH715_37205 [Streptomyces cellulosae]
MQFRMPWRKTEPPGRWRRVWERARKKAVVVRNRLLLGMVSGAGSACVSVAVVWWQNRR